VFLLFGFFFGVFLWGFFLGFLVFFVFFFFFFALYVLGLTSALRGPMFIESIAYLSVI